MQLDDYRGLKLRLDGFLKPGEQHKRNVLLETVYDLLPRDPDANVLVFSAEIAPGGYTSWHCHNGATFFICTQGLFEAHFQEGTLVKAKAGDVYPNRSPNSTAGTTRIRKWSILASVFA